MIFMKKRGMLYIIFLLLTHTAFAQAEPDVVPPPARGVYAVWYNKNKDVLNLPYIKGGQVLVQWADAEPVKGQYDFTDLDNQLAWFLKENKMATVEVNGNRKPKWMYDIFPHHPVKFSQQINDKQGSLMYWYPAYVEAYSNFIKAYGAHLKSSPYLAALAGVRMNFNPLGTEHFNIPDSAVALDQWISPAGVTPGTAWTHALSEDYQNKIAAVFINSFSGINLFLRNNINVETELKYKQNLLDGNLMLFHTSSEIEPRGAAMERKYHLFKTYALPGNTVAYAEPWADTWGYHGQLKDARWTSPGQYMYWRLLFDLHTGVSMPAIYGSDLDVAATGMHLREGDQHQYQKSFINAIRFAAIYAGYHASPSESPGVWVAFRHNEKNIDYSDLTEFTDNYSFLGKQLLPDNSTWKNITEIGSGDQRFGAWAKEISRGETIRLQFSELFLKNLTGKSSVVKVIYFDKGHGSFELAYNNIKLQKKLNDSRTWKTWEIPITQSGFTRDASGSNFILTTVSGKTIFHMVAIERGSGLPNDVKDVKVKKQDGKFEIAWKNPPDYDLDTINIISNNNVVQSVSAENEQLFINENLLAANEITIKTVDEAGRKSKGVKVKL